MGIIVFLSLILFIILNLNKVTYRIEVSLVDDHSPDRILSVYNNKNEQVEVKRIEYSDGTLLCNGYNMAVYFGDIKDETEFRVILKNNKEVNAKIIKKEVK